ncbi:IclR family transcriptional regulator [Arthrobacter sp. ISL-5]|uniref:IclR family transcriptional regulator n=1 Tax=Arthrobacter sp. ISL-5 TaxID=2819111 RepID=UPI001BE5DF21|nr:IclR family transcriptional regulator [Arthrobacter sp. ISL-5]MBT2555936.1 IclR family transcriptional regulator [Arthrobacter sp. ISL-5]
MKRVHPGETGLSRIVKVLESFDLGKSVLTPAEIVRRTGLPHASTYRLINELVQAGFLDRTEGGVQTGVRLWELASRESRTLSLRNTALPFMEDLQNVIRQHTQLSILDGTEILYLERLSAPEAVVNITRVAGRMPALITSPGLVLAAFGDRKAQDLIMSTTPPKYTDLTPTSTSDFRRMYAEIRRQGYARADGWVDEGVTGLSVQIGLLPPSTM